LTARFTLVTGRTKDQGQARHVARNSRAYQQVTAWIEMNAEDMARLGISAGHLVRVQTETGQAELPVRAGELPSGMVFMPLGPAASELSASDTDGTGMPLLKGLSLIIADSPGGHRYSVTPLGGAKQSRVESS
jgi:formylmethanofuran dehydrogenase subunit D